MSFDPISAVFDLGKSIISRVWPDPKQQADAFYKLQKLKQDGNLAELSAYVQSMTGQLEINKIEAASSSVFVAGWRPFVGWICGFALAYVAIIDPMFRFFALMFGYKGDFPVIDTTITMQVLLGMLGIGTLRSYDKKNKVDTKQIGEKK